MNVNKEDLEESFNHLTKEQQDSLLDSLRSIQLLTTKQLKDDLIKSIMTIIFKQPPLMNLAKFSYHSIDTMKELFSFIQYTSYAKNASISYSKQQESGQYLFILIAGNVCYSKNSYIFSLPHLLGKMKKFNLADVFKEITALDCDINSIPADKNNEFALLDILTTQLKQMYQSDDLYTLLELNEYRKTTHVHYTRPGETFGIEEILKFPKKNYEESAFKAMTPSHLFIIDKFAFTTILGKNFNKAINDRQKYIVSLCPFILSTNYSRMILRKSRYVYPSKGEALYTEKQQGDFIYLILKGSCVLKKRVYIDVKQKYSTAKSHFISEFNFIIPNRTKTINIITLGVGSFVGIEVLFNESSEYQYTLEVGDSSTLLCEFNYHDFYSSGIGLQMKKYLKEAYAIQESRFNSKLTSLNENSLSIDYGNIMQNEFLKQQSFPPNFIENCRKKLKFKETKVNCQIIRKLTAIHLNRKSSEKEANNATGPLSNLSMSSSTGQFFDNARISAFMTSLSPMSSRALLKPKQGDSSALKRLEKIKMIRKRQSNANDKPYNSVRQLLKSNSSQEFDTPLVLSLNNWMNSNKSYTTRSFKIPLVVMLKKVLKKSPSSVVYANSHLPG